MTMRETTFVRLVGACILLSGVAWQSASAQDPSGVSILGPTTPPVGGYAANPQEYLTISWSVTQVGSIYTYDYTVNNPLGDVILNNNGTLTTTPEVVDAFQVGFNTTTPGALVAGSITGGTFSQNNGSAGIFWSFNAVSPGSSSGVLSFESMLPPVQGNANSQNTDPPSPWSSTAANGQTVPVPGVVPEPSTLSLLALAGLLPFCPGLRRKTSPLNLSRPVILTGLSS